MSDNSLPKEENRLFSDLIAGLAPETGKEEFILNAKEILSLSLDGKENSQLSDKVSNFIELLNKNNEDKEFISELIAAESQVSQFIKENSLVIINYITGGVHEQKN